MKSVLRYVLDDKEKIGITLMTFDTLQEMDLYLQQFKDSNDVKEQYLDLINGFLRTPAAINYLREQAKKRKEIRESNDDSKKAKTRENNGSIMGYTPYRGFMRHVHLLYQNPLKSDAKCCTALREDLKDRQVLHDIKHRKAFLIPNIYDIKSEFNRVMRNHTTTYFVRDFVRYIEKLPEGEKYIVLRILSDKCNLQENKKTNPKNKYKIRFDKVGEVLQNFHLVEVKSYPFGEYADEEIYANPVIGAPVKPRDDVMDFPEFKKDISELLQEFDLDRIDRDTTYFDDVGKGAK